MVSTVDGKVTLSQSGAGIGSRTDRALMRQLRAAVDAVIIGGGTLRADVFDPRVGSALASERVRRGQPPQPLAIAVTGSLDLEPTNRVLVNGPGRTLILTTERAPTEARRSLAPYATILTVGEDDVDLPAALQTLHAEYGIARLLCEGGPTLNQRLLDLNLIDELFWTVAPKLAGGRGPGLFDADEPPREIRADLDLVSLFEEAGELFARYRVWRRGGRLWSASAPPG